MRFCAKCGQWQFHTSTVRGWRNVENQSHLYAIQHLTLFEYGPKGSEAFHLKEFGKKLLALKLKSKEDGKTKKVKGVKAKV